jgi:hypothetical protein
MKASDSCKIQVVLEWRGENNHHGELNIYPIFIPRFEGEVFRRRRIRVQDMLLRQSFLTPET